MSQQPEARDSFDELADQLGITRRSAIQTYCPSRCAELEAALAAVVHAVWQANPDLLEVIEGRLQAAVQVSQDRLFSEAASIAIESIRKQTGRPA